nr:MAG TPA: Concanavalin A-like lectin/glucanase superfamily protein [Herelleviridae sp.]
MAGTNILVRQKDLIAGAGISITPDTTSGNVTIASTNASIDESRLVPTGGKGGDILSYQEGADRGNGDNVRLLLQNALTDSANGNAAPAAVTTQGVTLTDANDLLFDGNDSHVTAVLATDEIFAADKEWTIDFWMKPTANSSEWNYILTENTGDWGSHSIGLTWNSDDSTLEQDTGGYLASVIRSSNWPNDAVACAADQWHFVAVEKQKTSTGWSLNYYLNGAIWLQVAFTGEFVPFDSSNPFWFGGKTTDSGRWFKGEANKLRVTAGARYGGKAFAVPDRLTDYAAPAGQPVWAEGIDRSRLLKVPTSADEGKLPVIRADKIPAVYHDTTLAAIVIEGDKVIDKISGKELTKVGNPQIVGGGIHSPTNSDYYMLELEGVEGLPVAVSFDYQGDESSDNSDIIIINGTCSYYNLNGVSFCRTQGGGNNVKIDNEPIGVSEVYRNYVIQVSSDNYESKTPPVAFIAGESKSPTYEGSFPSMSPLSSVKVCGRFGKIRNILIGSAFPYTGNFTPRGDGVEGFGVPEKQEPGWNYETLDEAANGRLLPANPANGDIPCFDATATVGGGIDDDTHLMLHFDEESGIPADSSQDEILVTANDTAANAATAKFGKARNLNNSSLSLTCPAMATGTGDFTYEGWFYFNELNKRRGLFGVDMGLYVALWNNNTFGVAISTSGSSWNYNHMDSSRSEATATQGVWQHIALVRNKGNVTLYLNGNSILSFDIGADTVITGNMGNNPFRIGYPLGGMSYVADFCDEFRFSTVARWTGNFTPPDAPYSKQVIEGEWGKLNKDELVKSVNGQTPDSSGAVTLPEATTSAAGLMSATDREKSIGLTTRGFYPNALAKSGAVDFNEVIDHGFYFIGGDTPHLNYPETYQQNGGTLQVIRNGNYLTQTFIPLNINTVFIRTCVNALSDSSAHTFSAWRRALTAPDITESKTSSGYFKLPGGTIVQWGEQQVTSGSYTKVVFPIVFPTAFVSGTAIVYEADVEGSVGGYDLAVSIGGGTVSGMSVYAHGDLFGTGGAIPAKFIAIGY